MTEPMLEAVRARIDVAGVPEVDGLSFATTGERVLILGGAPSLFECAAGLRETRHGELRIRGVAAKASAAQGLSAGAPLDPPIPLSWTPRQYVSCSARLAGHSVADARDHASDAMSKLKLDEIWGVPMRTVSAHARRAVVVAAAVATGAGILLLDDPLRGLPSETARTFARTLARATADVTTLVFAARMSLASPLATDADEAVVLHGSRVTGQGAPGEVAARDRTYALRVRGRGATFARLAEERGARVEGQGSHWTLDLGASLGTRDIFEVAAASDTVVLELHPLAQAFA